LGVLQFMAHPAQWDLLASRPDLADPAVEEVMRVRPTVTWVTRETMEDVEFQGVSIPGGTTVHLLSESAATDPLKVE
ncbi:cytochrome P450, partial [Stenotrophomonas maltophilia]|uniref:cytochrome P450 n=1 Tax=Stenotrophomonas maltophilia TaxID=40324 RepID=UPI0013DCE524